MGYGIFQMIETSPIICHIPYPWTPSTIVLNTLVEHFVSMSGVNTMYTGWWVGENSMRRRRGTRAPCHRIASNVTPTAPYALYATRGGGPGGLTIIAILDRLGGVARCVRGCRPNAWDSLPATGACKCMPLYGGLCACMPAYTIAWAWGGEHMVKKIRFVSKNALLAMGRYGQSIWGDMCNVTT